MSPARHRRSRYSRFDLGEPIRKIDHVPILLFCSLMACVFLFPAAQAPNHALMIDLNGFDFGHEQDESSVPTNEVRLTADERVLFNRIEVTQAELGILLADGIALNPEPEIVFAADPDADYVLVLHVLSIIKQSGVTEFCFGDLQRHAAIHKDWWSYPMRLSFYDPPPPPKRPSIGIPRGMIHCGSESYGPFPAIIGANPPPA